MLSRSRAKWINWGFNVLAAAVTLIKRRRILNKISSLFFPPLSFANTETSPVLGPVNVSYCLAFVGSWNWLINFRKKIFPLFLCQCRAKRKRNKKQWESKRGSWAPWHRTQFRKTNRGCGCRNSSSSWLRLADSRNLFCCVIYSLAGLEKRGELALAYPEDGNLPLLN